MKPIAIGLNGSSNTLAWFLIPMNRLLRTLYPDGGVRENSYVAFGNLIQTKVPSH